MEDKRENERNSTYERAYNLLNDSGICRRGIDSHIIGNMQGDDRMGIMEDNGSFTFWVPESSTKLIRFLDVLDYCDKNYLYYHYNRSKLGELTREIQTLSSLIDRLINRS